MDRVEETTNYAQFDRVVGNRPIRHGHASRIAKEIEKTGVISPILVDRDMRVLDGQHRLEAAKMLEMPVPYVVVKNGSSTDIVHSLNAVAKSWRADDYFRYYATRGNEQYQLALEVAEEYNQPIYTIAKLGGDCRRIPLGTWKFGSDGDTTWAKHVINTATELSRWHPRASKSQFILALDRIMKHPLFDLAEFKRKFETRSMHVPQCNSQTDYYRVLVDVMNFKRSANNRIVYS